MSSRLVSKLILVLAEKITAIVRKGRPLPTVIFALLGGGAGALTGLATIYLMGPAILLGAILGATIGAALCPRPPRALGARAGEDEPESMGAVQTQWACVTSELPTLAVLMERGIYVAVDQHAPWREVVEKLQRGEDPEIGTAIRLADLDCLEMHKVSDTGLTVVYHVGAALRRRGAYFANLEDRDKFLTALQLNLGKPFVQEERQVPLFRATITPLVLLSLVTCAVLGIAWLSSYWTAHPPLPPRGKAEPDELVRMLTSAGPTNVLLIGLLPVLALFAWLCFRVARPPHAHVLVPAQS